MKRLILVSPFPRRKNYFPSHSGRMAAEILQRQPRRFQNIIHVGFVASSQHFIFQLHSPCQFHNDFNIIFRLSDRLHCPLIQRKHSSPKRLDLLTLKCGAGRQYQIRHFGRVRPEQLRIDIKIQRSKCFLQMLRLRPHPVIQSHGKDCLQRIRILLQDIVRKSCALGLLTRQIEPHRKILLPDGLFFVITNDFSKLVAR